MDLVALNWAVLQMTDSPFYLGLVNACRLVPVFLLSIPAGVLADRFDRRKLLLMIQTGMMLLTFCLAYVIESQQLFGLFFIIVTLRAVLAAMDSPIRNAFFPCLVPVSSLTSAIAINTTAIHLSRMMGPALAGILLGFLELDVLFYCNAWGTLAVIFSLLLLRSVPLQEKIMPKKVQAPIREASEYVKSTPAVQSLLLLAIVPMVFGFPYTTMLPLFARDLLQLGSEGVGLLLSVSSAGALLGSLYLSAGREMKEVGKVLIYSILGFGLSLLLFIIVDSVMVAAFALFLAGLTSQVYRTLSRISIQLQVPDRLRGRILSIALMDRGFIPLGALLIGAVASFAGVFWAGVWMGGGCIAATLLVVVRRPQIWRI